MKITIEIDKIEKSEGFMVLQLFDNITKETDVIIDKQGFVYTASKYKSVAPFKSINSVTFLKDTNRLKTKVLLFVDGDDKWNEKMKKKHPIKFKLGLMRPYYSFVKELGTVPNPKDVDQIIDMLRYLKYKVEVYTEEVS